MNPGREEYSCLIGRPSLGMSSTGACPVWLQSALADFEHRMKSLTSTSSEPDSFAERAENYYSRRPQLISLLHDLHHRYINLADRYTQCLRSHQHHHNRLKFPANFDPPPDSSSSDAESLISFDRFPPQPSNFDLLIAELVSSDVERHILLSELSGLESGRAESARKMELQASLVEVLEAERMVLLGENARLGFQLAAATEEARGLALEAVYTRQKASELARCVVNMRAEQRVCLLGRKIGELQAKIYGLERRNLECYEAMAKQQVERVEAERLREDNRRLKQVLEGKQRRRRRAVSWWEVWSRWWDKLRRFEYWVIVHCGPEIRVKQ
ncbi:hypothetical protein HPP92_008286 [Vanilla planifolia]|uniref:NAB domain-containing protein n=1 Tax=Vanilla planifolia TaxID=51239 RepID=A0A835V3M6_VANPL|nr:hypothetical protein HPP92_008286 [Vanilla planifolia]